MSEEENYRDNIPEFFCSSEQYEKADEECERLKSEVKEMDNAIDNLEDAIEYEDYEHDPIEDTKEYLDIKEELEIKLKPYVEQFKAKAEKTYQEFGIYPPYSHLYWNMKKKFCERNMV